MSLKDTDVRTPGNAAIAKKWKLSLAKVNALVKIGAKHEKEHNTNESKAEEVARDHINERPDYYSMLKKAEKSKIKLKEESLTGDVRGLGFVSGDPAVSGVNSYVNTNAMAYEDENGNNLKVIKQAHLDYHNSKLGFNFFDPTRIKDSKNTPLKEGTTTSGGLGGKREGSKEDGPKYVDNNVKSYVRDLQIRADHQSSVHHDLHSDEQHDWFHSFKSNAIKNHSNRTIKESFKTKLQELGGMTGYEGLSDSPPKGRKNDQLEEGPLKDKAKKVAMAGMTAANMYTLADVAGRATEGGHGSPKGDVVRAASALPGVTGWGATALHYGNKGYKLARDTIKKKKGHMEETLKGSVGSEVAERGIYQEDWQKHKSPSGGLTQAGVDAYRRKNPGSKLQTAVTTKPSKLKKGSKAAKRRKSFCARMGGMKKRLTSAKTAHDPDSRINKALRKWNCEESVINELKAATPERLGRYISRASGDRKKALTGNKPDVKTWERKHHFIQSAFKKLTKENSKDKDWDAASGFTEQQSHLHLNKPDTKYAPGASGLTHTIHEETKMDNKNLVNEAIENILENDLNSMKENLMTALQEKAQEKLEERKKLIAANYFAQ